MTGPPPHAARVTKRNVADATSLPNFAMHHLICGDGEAYMRWGIAARRRVAAACFVRIRANARADRRTVVRHAITLR
ncbi:hypothetical protein LYSCAS_19290 [Lysobacter caseinilyticus]|uniref:Uncharacterized protein n=1 Tax=Noviluteimonas caseinilytica TaxID=2675101 RepID=A0ABN6FU72_9GAMM|nr:hypothetical protein LYSCAS_19290 [Lysobacter caseinilyticus]